jgi:hypothetical protein
VCLGGSVVQCIAAFELVDGYDGTDMSDDQKNALSELYELNKAVEELNKSMDGFLGAIRKRIPKNDT